MKLTPFGVSKTQKQLFTGDVCLRLLGGREHARRLAHVVRALRRPRDLSGVPGGEHEDRHSVHDQVAVLDLLKLHI